MEFEKLVDEFVDEYLDDIYLNLHSKRPYADETKISFIDWLKDYEYLSRKDAEELKRKI